MTAMLDRATAPKLILSRKGFDTAAGGGPSPILPDGTLLSLPIPSDDTIDYRQVSGPGGDSLARTMRQLGIRPRPRRRGCHLDPDLDGRARPRPDGWRPAFGNVGAAGSHLLRHGVGAGDLFLFFGWFRQTVWRDRRLTWCGPDRHVIFGYLQVGERMLVRDTTSLPAWLKDHPHAHERLRSQASNLIYIAADHLSLPGARAHALSGAGVLPLAEHRVLTAHGQTRSRWNLPPAVFGDRDISYHSPRSWRDGWFQSAKRGQEFVLEMNEAVAEWVAERLAP